MKPLFETEDSKEMSKEGEFLRSKHGDILPLPKRLGVKDYIYVAFIWIPPRQRRKGLAKKYFRDLLKNKRAVVIRLVDGLETNGTVLEPFLKSMGFVRSETSQYEIEMVRK